MDLWKRWVLSLEWKAEGVIDGESESERIKCLSFRVRERSASQLKIKLSRHSSWLNMFPDRFVLSPTPFHSTPFSAQCLYSYVDAHAHCPLLVSVSSSTRSSKMQEVCMAVCTISVSRLSPQRRTCCVVDALFNVSDSDRRELLVSDQWLTIRGLSDMEECNFLGLPYVEQNIMSLVWRLEMSPKGFYWSPVTL